MDAATSHMSAAALSADLGEEPELASSGCVGVCVYQLRLNEAVMVTESVVSIQGEKV